MACGGKITKGGGMVVAIPFDATDVENLVVSVYTNGDEKIEKSGDDIRIGNGVIYVDMSKTDVDLLADGVVNYTMDYEIDGVQYSENGGTTNYIKTPKDYSATSVTDLVQSAYTEGREVGYVEGHAQGKQDGEAVGYDEAVSTIRNQSISLSVSANGTYSANTQDNIYFNEVNVNVPQAGSGICENIQQQKYIYVNQRPSAGEVIIHPDDGFDGVWEGIANIDNALDAARDEGANIQKGKLEHIYISANGEYWKTDGYSYVNVSVQDSMMYENDCHVGLGFYGPAELDIHEDSEWERDEPDTKLGYYIRRIVCQELGTNYTFDEMSFRQEWHHTFGEGYHTIWFELGEDVPVNRHWIDIHSGGTYNTLNVITVDNEYDWTGCYPNNTLGQSFDIHRPQTDTEQLLKHLYEH